MGDYVIAAALIILSFAVIWAAYVLRQKPREKVEKRYTPFFVPKRRK